MSADGLILSVDPKTWDVTKDASFALLGKCDTCMYLVESPKKLFLIYLEDYLKKGDDGDDIEKDKNECLFRLFVLKVG